MRRSIYCCFLHLKHDKQPIGSAINMTIAVIPGKVKTDINSFKKASLQ